MYWKMLEEYKLNYYFIKDWFLDFVIGIGWEDKVRFFSYCFI